MPVVEHGVADIGIQADMVDDCGFDDEQVKAVARGIRKDGVTVFPTVRASTSEVVVGHIVVAACLSLGRSVCRCRLIDGKDHEIEEMRHRHASTSGLDPEETMLRTIQSHMEEIVGGKVGKARGAKSAAIRRYAKAMGIEEAAAKQRYMRAGRRLRHKRFMLEDRYATPPIDSHVGLDRDFTISLYHTMDRFRHIKAKLTESVRVLEAMHGDPHTGLPESRYMALRSSIERAQRMVHAGMPGAVCLKCGGEDEGVRAKCMTCLGMGYTTVGVSSD